MKRTASMKTITLALLLCVSCAGSLRSQAHVISDRAAIVTNAGTHTMLALYCLESMRSIGRVGTLTGDHCVESGPRQGTPATTDEIAHLELIRTHWAGVMAAAEVVVQKHTALRLLISAAENISDGQILEAVGDLASSYEAMRQAATTAGITPPPALALE